MRTGNVLEALKFKHPRKLHNCLWNIVSILPGGLNDAPDLLADQQHQLQYKNVCKVCSVIKETNLN